MSVWSRIGRSLHANESHPIGIMSGLIHEHFESMHGGNVFKSVKVPDIPIVTANQAFDDLLVPADHVLRSSSDTFYVTKESVLRPHATSHQKSILSDLRVAGKQGAVWTCDVFRRDEVDRIHFPVFHQTDGVRVFDASVSEKEIIADLENSIESLILSVFKEAGKKVDMRWDRTAFFPFTNPSMELEIRLLEGKHAPWIECLGCGKIRREIDLNGWAFGMGIDRLAMLLFGIDDIRLLWSQDERFLSQFSSNTITEFKPFSKYPPTFRDIAFWVMNGSQKDIEQRFSADTLRAVGPYGLEKSELIDKFVHPKSGQVSLCFRLTYRGIEKTLTSEECNRIHSLVEQYVVNSLGCEVRS